MRLEGKASAGFFATPPHLTRRIAALLRAAGDEGDDFAVLDPCAGEGAAVLALAGALFPESSDRYARAKVYALEMEASRFAVLRRETTFASSETGAPGGFTFDLLHGDAFASEFSFKDSNGNECEGVNVLFLNPPYEEGKLEARFLEHFTPALTIGGVLVFVVPFYALARSADFLAANFSELACFRFPAADFAAYRQVVLVGQRREALMSPSPAVRAQVMAWAASAEASPELPEAGPPVLTFSGCSRRAGIYWRLWPLDVAGLLAAFQPWSMTDRSGAARVVDGILPATDANLLRAICPVAMPPKPAHIAAAMAAGCVNGARVEADDPASGRAPLLTKAVFLREFQTTKERHDAKGEVAGEEQVQAPRLVVTVLDLTTKRYRTLESSDEVTGATETAQMTAADLITSYGRSMMARVRESCPVLHDPARAEDAIQLPELARPLYRAQAHAAMAGIKLLSPEYAALRADWDPTGHGAPLNIWGLGEIGSGKSGIALTIALGLGARRVLAMVPPHLVPEWPDHVNAIRPGARVVTLETMDDVDALAADTSPEFTVAIIGREIAKLGHAYAGIGPSIAGQRVCPKCGAPAPAAAKAHLDAGEELARKRARCTARSPIAAGRAARAARELALALLPSLPESHDVGQWLTSRIELAWQKRLTKRPDPKRWLTVRDGAAVRRAVTLIVSKRAAMKGYHTETTDEVLGALLWAIGDHALIARVARQLYAGTVHDRAPGGDGARVRGLARELLLLLPPGSTEQNEAEGALRAHGVMDEGQYGGSSPWWTWVQARNAMAKGNAPQQHGALQPRKRGEGWTRHGHALGSLEAAEHAMVKLGTIAGLAHGEECGEPLFQATPDPRRYPLATYIATRYPDLFDFFALDEGHEAAGEGSAQGFAAHRLTLLGKPTIYLTGSVMNGYASSLFGNQWALDRRFRAEFKRDQRGEFSRRFGYRKRLVQEVDGRTRAPVAFGSSSDRVETVSRDLGESPGVLPLFVIEYLLRSAITVHKADLGIDLPPCHEIVEVVEPGPELFSRYKRIEKALTDRIKKDRFNTEGLSGKLFGAMSDLPSYLDLATSDTGNEDGSYVVRYPDTPALGSYRNQEIVRAAGFPAETILPKEAWMLATVRRELAEGRNCLVFAWNSDRGILARLARLVSEAIGEPVPILYSEKVPPAKRKEWINREIVAKGVRVMICNPVCVQTGLNNLVTFCTQIHMQNPAVNPTVYDQAGGRSWRIGQTKTTRIYFPVYAGTVQEFAHRLLLHKVAVARGTSGIDAASAMAAAGIGQTGIIDGMSVGRMLFEIVSGERRVPGAPVPAAPVPAATLAPAARQAPRQLSLFS